MPAAVAIKSCKCGLTIKMIKKNHNKKSGFTLVETIVTIFIFSILALGVNTLFTHIYINSRDRLISMDNADYARSVAFNFTNELRVAVTGHDGSFPLNQAGDNQIIFYSNYKQADGLVARFRYFLATSTLYKGVVTPSGSPLSYNLAQEKITAIQNNIVSTGGPIFYYYDGNYTGTSSPFTQPVNVNQVKYVRLSLNILKQDQKVSASTFTVSAGTSIRSLKTNLGN